MAEETDVSGAELSQTTGRYLVVYADDAPADAAAASAGAHVAHTADFASDASIDVAHVLRDADAVYFDELKVAVTKTPPQQSQLLGVRGASASPVAAVAEERWVYPAEELTLQRARFSEEPAALPAAEGSRDYARGYRDGASDLYFRLFGSPDAAGAEGGLAAPAAALWNDTAQRTWGLAATRADQSAYTGRGIRVAVLDTGFTRNHPDFPPSRGVTTANFVSAEPPDDLNGHGTHCIGTALGPRQPNATTRRYGVAGEAEIFSGKVLALGGSGDSVIVAGIEWALRNGCRIISMSLAARVRPGQPHSPAFELIAQRAMARGALLVAAAGNDSNRPGVVLPVSHPANCPSIMAVAAIDAFARVATFSNRAVNPGGGQVDIAGPGVNVYSSWRTPLAYRSISGTSMATPHVAGIAAQYLQRNPALTPQQLWTELQQRARRFPALAPIDVGAGLVQSV